MKKGERTVKVAVLKAKLSAYLRSVRRGHPVTVCERETPIARLVPIEAGAGELSSRRPVRQLREVQLPPPLAREVDSLGALLEEREPQR